MRMQCRSAPNLEVRIPRVSSFSPRYFIGKLAGFNAGRTYYVKLAPEYRDIAVSELKKRWRAARQSKEATTRFKRNQELSSALIIGRAACQFHTSERISAPPNSEIFKTNPSTLCLLHDATEYELPSSSFI